MSTSPLSSLQPLLRTLGKHAELNSSEEAAILALPHEVRTIEAGQYMVCEGDQSDHCLLVTGGFCFRHKILGNGSRSISSIHMKGDMVDLHNAILRIADHSVQALSRCRVAKIPQDAIRAMVAAFPQIASAMWRSTLVDGSISREWTANVGRRDAATRLMHLLCEFGTRLQDAGIGDRSSYDLPMTQEQLADATGLTPVHVNRTLKDLQDRGLIERRVRHVHIADWHRAEDSADFNTNYLHLSEIVPATRH
jgi:CRP-like cAMP-binding protein